MPFKTVFIGNSVSVYSVAFLNELKQLDFDICLIASSKKNLLSRRKNLLSKIWTVASNFTVGEIATGMALKLAKSFMKNSSWVAGWRDRYFVENAVPGCEYCCPASINDPEFVEKVRQMKPDLILLHSFSEILKEELIAIPLNGCYNFHPGRLPENRGPNPIEWTVLTRQKNIVTDCHKVTPAIDDGAVVARAELSLGGVRSWRELTQRARESTAKCLVDFHDALVSGKLSPLPLDGRKCYNRRPGALQKYKAHLLSALIYRRMS